MILERSTKLRYLNFKVKGQSIEKVGDFEGLVANSKGYLKAVFQFSDDWAFTNKVAIFETNGCTKYSPVISGIADIPDECLEYNNIYVSVEGRRSKDGYRIVTDKVKITQKGGKNIICKQTN